MILVEDRSIILRIPRVPHINASSECEKVEPSDNAGCEHDCFLS